MRSVDHLLPDSTAVLFPYGRACARLRPLRHPSLICPLTKSPGHSSRAPPIPKNLPLPATSPQHPRLRRFTTTAATGAAAAAASAILHTLCGPLAVRIAARLCAGLYSRPASDSFPGCLPPPRFEISNSFRTRRGRCLTTLHLPFIPPSPTTFLPFGDQPARRSLLVQCKITATLLLPLLCTYKPNPPLSTITSIHGLNSAKF